MTFPVDGIFLTNSRYPKVANMDSAKRVSERKILVISKRYNAVESIVQTLKDTIRASDKDL